MKNYTLTLSYVQIKRNERVDVTRSAVLAAGDMAFNLQDIATFLDDIRKIYNDVKRLAKLCETVEIELTVAEYSRHGHDRMQLRDEDFKCWTYAGIAEADGIHLEPDTRYVPESHDMWLDFGKFDPLHDITA